MNTKKHFSIVIVILLLLAGLLMMTGCSWLGLRHTTLDELKLEYANEKSEFIPINGMNVHVRDEGQGPVLVLLHGVAAELHTWDGWVPELTKHYRVIRMDLPGFGMTGMSEEKLDKLDIELVKDTVLKVLKSRQVSKATFIGNSFGGYLSWRLAADYPDLVERIVAIDAVSFPQKWPWTMRSLTWFPTRQIAPYYSPLPYAWYGVHMVYGDGGRIAKGTVRRYHRMLLYDGNRNSLVNAIDWLIDTSRPFEAVPEEGLLGLKQPLMTMWGKKDKLIPFNPIGLRWQNEYPNGVHKVYEDAGHVPMEEIPERTVKDLLEFLRTTDPQLGYGNKEK